MDLIASVDLTSGFNKMNKIKNFSKAGWFRKVYRRRLVLMMFTVVIVLLSSLALLDLNYARPLHQWVSLEKQKPTADSGIFFIENGSLIYSDLESRRTDIVQVEGIAEAIFKHNESQGKLLIGTRPVEGGSSGLDLDLYDTRNKAFTRLVNGQIVLSADLSPDGEKVAYSTIDQEIRIVELQGMRTIRVFVGSLSPRWAPTGEKLAYVSLLKDDEGRHISVVDVLTGNVEIVTDGHSDSQPEWTLDGRYVVFVSGSRTGLASFWIAPYPNPTKRAIQLTNRGQQQVTESFIPVPSGRLVWLNQSTFLYPVSYHPRKEIWFVELARELDGVISARKIDDGTYPTLREGKLIFLGPAGYLESVPVDRLHNYFLRD